MKKANTANELFKVLEYIKPHKGECIYMYIDLIIYGIEEPFIDLWYEKDVNGVCFVVMRYHSSLQIYSHNNSVDYSALMQIVKTYHIKIINGKVSLLSNLQNSLSSYTLKSGWMFRGKMKKELFIDEHVLVELAVPEDAEEIATLMCSSEQWSNTYNVKDLALQLKERMESGMGRSFIIKDNNKIVAHDATFAETPDLVMASGLIVKEEYVDRMYAAILGAAMDRIFLAEGKEKFFHISDKRRMRMYQLIGHELIAETGKLIKKD